MQKPHQPLEDDDQRRASQPLYEFSSESLSDKDTNRAAPEEEAVSEQVPGRLPTKEGLESPNEEAIRQGLIYPPPPSFYQQEADQVTSSAGEALQALPVVPSPLPQPLVGFPPPGYQGGTTSQGVAPPFVPGPPPPTQPVARRSRRATWMVFALLGGVFLLSCGLCSWAGLTLVTPIFQSTTRAMNVVDDYYEAIQAKNYEAAYRYLSPEGTINGLSREQFIAQAQKQDTELGPVLSYTPSTPTFGSGNRMNLSQMTVPVQVNRAKLHYATVLTVKKVGSDWKIVDYNRV
jgi:hypothetical protein